MNDWLLDRRYELLEPLGRGGMGEVVRARDVKVDRFVAVKFLAAEHSQDASFVRRFRREIQTLAKLNHPNIVTLFDVGETDKGQLYLVMECLRGETLAATLSQLRARGEVMSWQRLAPIVRQIGHALAAAHSLGVVHRDIKPSNCFRSDNVAGTPDFIHLLDFGIVKPLSPGTFDHGAETTQHVFLGTPHYAAPETIDPQKYGPAGVQADIFSLGVLMYRCLTGTVPFEDLMPSVALARAAYHLAEPPRRRAPERDIPPLVEALVMRTMALHPQERHASMD